MDNAPIIAATKLHTKIKGTSAVAQSPTATILVVDDAPENLGVLAELLQPLYRVQAANSGEKALRIAAGAPRPDLILLDVMMPGIDGYEVYSRLRNNAATADVPVIFITAMGRVDDELRGLEIGAADYITKPIVPAVVLARVHTQLELKQARDRLRDQNAWLEAEVDRRMAENDLTQLVSIRALAHLAETRDPETGNHILRTQEYVRLLAHRLQAHRDFRDVLGDHYIDLLTRSAPLHDIGKVGIPDSILRKPGKLSVEEWTIMKTHARLGAAAIERAERDIATPVEFLKLAKEIAHWHHEKWNGNGYPDGLAGNAIPVSARLMAVADVFDALTSERVYRPALPYEQTRKMIAAGRCSHFDPIVVDAFLDDYEEFVAIAEQHRDNP